MPTSNTVKSATAIGLLALITSISVIVERITRPTETYVTWDQVITSPDTINSIKFKAYIDDSLVGKEIVGVVCTFNETQFLCQTKINNLNLTPELHVIRISTIGAGGESIKSNPIEVNFLVVH